MNACKEKAYAKVNLYLDCIAKRDDGFHDIKTIMHSLSLYDEITVSLVSRDKRSIRIFLDGNRRLPTDSKNLCYAAAERFLDRAAIDADVIIRLDKRIPVAAGLAGGSSDAAATLRAMNRLFSRPFTEKVLLDIAAEIGSDVPYCLIGGTALCEGRGEKITRLESSLSLYTVIAIDNERVSTPQAYAALDLLYNNFDGSVPTVGDEHYRLLVESIDMGICPDALFNIFESAILPVCPGAAALKEELRRLGAVSSLMSGSGPSVFGIFNTEQAAKDAADTLAGRGIRAYFAKTV